MALAQELRHRRIRHDKGLHAAVGLGHFNVQITAARGVAQVVDLKWARRNCGFEYHLPTLPDGHAGIGLCHAAYHRRIATEHLRQHARIGAQIHTGVADRIE